jgi:hypothetical protein
MHSVVREVTKAEEIKRHERGKKHTVRCDLKRDRGLMEC